MNKLETKELENIDLTSSRNVTDIILEVTQSVNSMLYDYNTLNRSSEDSELYTLLESIECEYYIIDTDTCAGIDDWHRQYKEQYKEQHQREITPHYAVSESTFKLAVLCNLIGLRKCVWDSIEEKAVREEKIVYSHIANEKRFAREVDGNKRYK